MSGFRLLQFNMQFGQGWDAADPDGAPINLDATIAEIVRHDADIITLQEVEQAGPDGAQVQPPVNFIRLCEALPGYHSHFSYPKADARELPFGIGLALFSRTPLTDRLRLDLPSPDIEFEFMGQTKTPTDRMLIGACTEIEGRPLTIYDTHLLAFFMLNSSSEIHGEQRRRIAALLAETRGPAVLAGDFNVSRPASLVAQFAAVGFRSAQQETVTWHRKPYVLDHIFHNTGLRCTACRVVDSHASDHLPLVADFEFAE